jgi:UPF0271 protein
MEIDLNADLGEGGDNDADLLTLVTSVNIACGFHAGDASTALSTLRAAHHHGVRCGVHPSFPDRPHFGRREIARTEQEVFADCVYQIGALAGLAASIPVRLSHLKLHGALYNMACRDDAYALPAIAAAKMFSLPVFGLPGSRLESLCQNECRFIGEGFADRRYHADQTLVARTEPGAIIVDSDEACRQVEWLVRDHDVRTICIHGDHPDAVGFTRSLRGALIRAGHVIKPFDVS